MPNIKISDLNRANRLSDEALIVVVQDKSNKTVTVKDLANKINREPNSLISKLNEELNSVSQGTNVIKLKNLVSKHEFRLNKIDEANNKQNSRIRDIEKTNRHLEEEINKSVELTKKNIREAELNRKAITFVNSKVENLSRNIKLSNKYCANLIDKVKNFTSPKTEKILDYIKADGTINVDEIKEGFADAKDVAKLIQFVINTLEEYVDNKLTNKV